MEGHRVREQRKRLGLSQQDVADRMGELGYQFSRVRISIIERKQRVEVRADTLYGLAKALDVQPSFLLGEPPKPKKPKHTMFSVQEQRRALESLLSTLDEPMRKVLELRFGLADGCIHTFEETGDELNLSRERVRQIENKAIRRLRHPIRRVFIEQLIGLHDYGVRKLLSRTGLQVSLQQAAIFAQCHSEYLVELKQAGKLKTHNKDSEELYSLSSLASVNIAEKPDVSIDKLRTGTQPNNLDSIRIDDPEVRTFFAEDWYSLPADDKEWIRRAIRMVRNNLHNRIFFSDDWELLSKEDKEWVSRAINMARDNVNKSE